MTYTREELERLIPPPSSARRPYPARPDYMAALADYLRTAAGRAVQDPEPMAREWVSNRLNIGEVRSASGLSSADFGSLLEGGLSAAMAQTFDDAAAGIKAVTRDYQVIDYKPVDFVELGIGAPVELPEDRPSPKLPFGITENAGDSPLKEYGGRISFSYPVWVSYGPELTAQLENYATNFAGLEHSLIASVLAAASPPSVSGYLNVDGLAAAVGALRTQLNASGQKTNWELRAILVPPDDEVTARLLAFNCGGWPNVVVNPELPTGSWYAFVSPDHSPLLRVRLRDAGRPRVYVKPGCEGAGAQMAVAHDIGFALLDGPGIVKVTP